MKWILIASVVMGGLVLTGKSAEAGGRCFVVQRQRFVAAPVVVRQQRFVRQPVFVQRQRFVRQPVFVQRQRFVRQPVFVQRRAFIGGGGTLRNLSLLGVFGRDTQRFSAVATGLGF